MTEHESKGKDALLALLTLCGQNTYHHDALTQHLIRKGIITRKEVDEALQQMYDRGISPAEWARRCMNLEDNDALNTFFE